MPVLYFKKTSIQALRWNTGKDSNWNCVFHVGFVAIQSSIVLLTNEDICPPPVGVVLKFRTKVGIIVSIGNDDFVTTKVLRIATKTLVTL